MNSFNLNKVQKIQTSGLGNHALATTSLKFHTRLDAFWKFLFETWDCYIFKRILNADFSYSLHTSEARLSALVTSTCSKALIPIIDWKYNEIKSVIFPIQFSLLNKIKKMKVVSFIGSLKNRSKDCQIVKRRGRIYVICKSDPRVKLRQGRAKMKRK